MRLSALRSEKQWVFGIFDPIDMQKTFDTWSAFTPIFDKCVAHCLLFKHGFGLSHFIFEVLNLSLFCKVFIFNFVCFVSCYKQFLKWPDVPTDSIMIIIAIKLFKVLRDFRSLLENR